MKKVILSLILIVASAVAFASEKNICEIKIGPKPSPDAQCICLGPCQWRVPVKPKGK